MRSDDTYYAEILIEIDGWLWNLADAPCRAPRLRWFPSAEKLLAEWEARDQRRAA